jgi:hypothetical protein
MIKPVHIILTLLMLLCAFLWRGIGEAIAQEEDYDPNTEITLKGAIIELSQERGPVTFLLKANEKLYQVMTGPWWYLNELELKLDKNMEVQVTGSKLYDREGNLHVMAYSLKVIETDKTYQFRDDNMLPLWRGRGNRGMQRQRSW